MDKVIAKFILFNLIFFYIVLYSTFHIHNYYLEKRKKPKQSFFSFLNNSDKFPSLRVILTGLVFGFVFGFIDNIGLWLGIDFLQKYLPGGILTKSALGNTYSDFVGSILGTCISIIVYDIYKFDEDNSPIWVNSIGIVLGCIFGLIAGRLITGRE